MRKRFIVELVSFISPKAPVKRPQGRGIVTSMCTEEERAIHKKSRQSYGERRIKDDLADMGKTVSRKRISLFDKIGRASV